MAGRPQDLFSFLVPFRLALLTLVLTFMATLMENKLNQLHKFFSIPETKLYMMLYLLMLIGIPFAMINGRAFSAVTQGYLMNMLFFFLFLLNVDSMDKLMKVLWILFLSLFLYVVYTLLKGSYADGRLYVGTMYDSNELAYFFISFLPLSVIFLFNETRLLKKIMVIFVLTMTPIVIFLTGSRGGFIALGSVVSLVLLIKKFGGSMSKRVIATLLVIVLFLSFGGDIVTNRFKNLTSDEGDYNITSEAGRVAIWKTGMVLIKKNPFFGVGTECYAPAFMEQRVSEGRLPLWKTAHNSFVQIAAEVGVPAFIIFLLIIKKCLSTFYHFAGFSIHNNQSHRLPLIAKTLFVSMIGSMVAAFFLSQAYSLFFTIYFSFSVVLKVLFTDFNAVKNSKSEYGI